MDVSTWLAQLGLEQYEAQFLDNDVTAEILPQLTADDLRDIGVASVGHRRRLLGAIAALQVAAPEPAPAPIPKRPAPLPERRQLTVLFCDLVGSTPLARALDPEDLREVIRAYQDCCAGMIARYAGHVARFMGDGVLAYFGYPIAHEDDAERAVRAALDLVRAIGRLSPQPGLTLQLRIGIATGTVVVGDLVGERAAQEEAVVGETPALAARLQAAARANEILISARTRRLIGGLFDCVDTGGLTLKGFTEPVPAWRVTGESASEDRFAAFHAAAFTDLVGREREIDLLLDRWSLAANGEGQVTLLSGEPGIGKSRIAQALRERIADQPHLRLHHSCSPHHQNSALYPIIGRLEHAAGFSRDDTLADKRAKIERVLGPAGASSPDALPMMQALLGLLPEDQLAALSPTAEQQKARTFKALLAQLEELSRQQPVMMVFEDVQWIDPTTSELLNAVIDRIQTLKVLLIVTYRPDFSPPWTGHAHVTTLSLNRLSQAQRVAMIERIAGKPLPPEVMEHIIVKTDGIPLFVEELTKTVLESGMVEERDGLYVLRGPLPAAIPATLHDSLMARLDRLSPVKDVAQIAAAIGREFSYELLAAIVPMVEVELQKALGLLVAANIFFGRGTPPDAIYSFKHALLQDVAYEAALRRTRQELHARIAAALIEKFPETATASPELVAHHYTVAGLAEQAIIFWAKAGRLAAARSANIEARNHLQKGLELLGAVPDGPARRRHELDLLAVLGPVLIALAGFAAEETVQVYRRLRELSEALDHPAMLFPALYGEWLYHAARAEHRSALGIAARFSDLAPRHRLPGLRVIAHRITGVSQLCLGELNDSRTNLEALLSRYTTEVHGELAWRYGTDPAVSAHSFLSWVLWLQGQAGPAIEHRARAIALAREFNHSHSLAHALGIGGCLLDCMRGDESSAAAHADSLLALAREHSFPYWLAAGRAAQGWLLMRRGRGEAAEVLLDAIAQARRACMEEFRPLLLTMLAQAYAQDERPDLGLKVLDEAIERVERTEERWIEAELYRLRGTMRLATGEREAAEADLRRAIVIARRQGARMWEARAEESLAALPPPKSRVAPHSSIEIVTAGDEKPGTARLH
jgi:class 3 adenylate cyclase/tetratricopeptide (TPR) repeat protein